MLFCSKPPKKKKKVEKPKAKASPEKSSPKKKVVKAKEAKGSPKKKTTKDKEKDKKVSKKPAKKGGPVAVKITPLKKASPKKTPKKGTCHGSLIQGGEYEKIKS